MPLSCYTYAVNSMEVPSFAVKTEAASNDIAQCSRDVKPSTGMSAFGCETLDY